LIRFADEGVSEVTDNYLMRLVNYSDKQGLLHVPDDQATCVKWPQFYFCNYHPSFPESLNEGLKPRPAWFQTETVELKRR